MYVCMYVYMYIWQAVKIMAPVCSAIMWLDVLKVPKNDHTFDSLPCTKKEEERENERVQAQWLLHYHGPCAALLTYAETQIREYNPCVISMSKEHTISTNPQ